MRPSQDLAAAIVASALVLAALGTLLAFAAALAELPDVDTLDNELRPMIDK